jgi:hypothetical protein
MSQEATEFPWRKFENATIEQKILALASIFATECLQTAGLLFDALEKQFEKPINDEETKSGIFYEIILLHLFLLDYNALASLGDSGVKDFREKFAPALIDVLCENDIEKRAELSKVLELFPLRAVEYAPQYEKLLTHNDGDGVKGTLFWEFGKKVAETAGCPNDAFVIHAVAMVIWISYRSMNFSEFFKIYSSRYIETYLSMPLEKYQVTYTRNGERRTIILEAISAEDAKEKSRTLFSEGVREQDIEWWNNLSAQDKLSLLKQDEVTRMALYAKERYEGKSPEEAAATVRKAHPIYGNPKDTSHTTGDDRPLPIELKDRVNSYIMKRMRGDHKKYKRDIETSSSFNALVRKEIRAGNL